MAPWAHGHTALPFLRTVFIDTHAHLYADKFAEDRAAMVQRALDAGVTKLYLPNIDAASVTPMHDLCEAFPDACFPMMGLHPCHVGADPEEELANVERLLGERRYAAVGEIGIDLYWDKSNLVQQQMAFRQQLRWAKEKKLPVAIHCRESFIETITIVEEEKTPDLRGVFHCFSGSPSDAARAIALDGFYLGIGGVITYPKSGLAQTMAEVGAEHCVLETDAPYLAPVPHRGKRNESSYIPFIAQALATATGRSLDDIARSTTRNAQQLFS